jgi:hypothetical protein
VRVEAHGAVALGAELAQLCLEALRVKPVPACRENHISLSTNAHQLLVPAACKQHFQHDVCEPCDNMRCSTHAY